MNVPNGVVYARYRDPSHNKKERWVIGGDPGAVARAQGKLLDYPRMATVM